MIESGARSFADQLYREKLKIKPEVEKLDKNKINGFLER